MTELPSKIVHFTINEKNQAFVLLEDGALVFSKDPITQGENARVHWNVITAPRGVSSSDYLSRQTQQGGQSARVA